MGEIGGDLGEAVKPCQVVRLEIQNNYCNTTAKRPNSAYFPHKSA
jgi:hypothetical protein